MTATGAGDPLPEYLKLLNRAYKTSRLSILVGAGASMRAGFPSWEKLNLGLLNAFLQHDLQATHSPALGVLTSFLPKISQTIYSRLGREALDLIWAKSNHSEFYELVGRTLYEQRAIDELPIPSLHRQIAAMVRSVIFTANYDPLLELAMLRIRKGVRNRPGQENDQWREYLKATGTFEPGGYSPEKIHHIHGFVEPNGDRVGQCVFTEGHYYELAANQKLPANQTVLDILQGDGELVILGMSLSDPNVRRLLYERQKNSLKTKEVYVVLKEEDELVSTYQEMHWRTRDVKIIWIRDYDDIEDLLRQIKFGPYEKGKPPAWVVESVKWLRHRQFPERFFEDKWQLESHTALVKLKEQIELLFPRQYGERIDLHFLSLSGVEPKLRLMARTQDGVLDGAAARDRAEKYTFGIDFGAEQGSSGSAFVQGQPDEALDDSQSAHRNIERRRREEWYRDQGFQDWRSILSIPIADSSEWVPVAVIAVTSTFAKPFWAGFNAEKDDYLSELKSVMRGACARFLLKEN